MREMVTSGSICVDDEYGFTYHVADIDYIEREDETYCYTIRPDYAVIELLAPPVFQGIPGLDLDLRKEVYVRENMVPVFISERSPGENSEDLWVLLESCNMDYLNRLEWLIRTDTRYSGDGLYVLRRGGEDLEVDSLEDLGNRSSVISRRALEVICGGRKLITNQFVVDDTNRKMCFEIFMSMYKKERKYLEERRKDGIQKATESGKYKGRSRIKLDSMELQESFHKYEQGKLTGEQAADLLDVSKSTFIRRYREYLKGINKSNN